MILRPLCTWQRWISAKSPKVSRTARLRALAPSRMNKRAISGRSPRSTRSASSALTTAAFSVAPKASDRTCLSPAPSMPIAATRTWSPTRSPSIWITKRSSPDRSAASHSFSFAVLSATNRRETEEFVRARRAFGGGGLGWAGQIAGRQPYRPCILARRYTDQHLVERPARQKVRLLDRAPAGKLQFATAALPHPRPPNGSFAAMPADLATDRAPAMALPIRVPLVALATKLFRIRRKHRLAGRSPSLQAQPVEAALELLKSFNHQRGQCKCSGRQRRPLVRRLRFDMLRHGVDLLALGLRFATSSLVA